MEEKDKRKWCRCTYAVIAAAAAVVLVAFVGGQGLSGWGFSGWLAGLAIIGAAYVCFICRQSEDNGQE